MVSTIDGPTNCIRAAEAISRWIGGLDCSLNEECIKEGVLRNIAKVKKGVPKHRTYIRNLNCLIAAIDEGYKDWNDFCEKSIPKYDFQKGFKGYNRDQILNLEINQEIVVGWYPHCYASLCYKGDCEFKVIDSSGVRHNAGASFCTIGFSFEKTNPSVGFPSIIIDPILDDDPAYDKIKLGCIPLSCIL